MILLDTNVISELLRPKADPAVDRWLTAQPGTSVFISAITEAELRYGIALLPPGRRRSRLLSEVEQILRDLFHERILSFDSAAARRFTDIAVTRRQCGRPIGQADAQIASIAASRRAVIATRNVTDFEDCGVDLVNPWVAH